tara:strand:+ start:2330 stop:3538 length:1209 start_codon:yes stop_codon:yes gene_type:complete
MCARRLCFALTIDDYNARAKDMGWTFKDEVPEVGGTKVNWECNHGHPVYASYHTVKLAHKLGNLGCKQCYRNSQRGLPLHLTEEQALQYFGKSKGIRWTGETLPANGEEKTDWVCEAHGHKFTTSYGIIKQGTGCPRCADEVSLVNILQHVNTKEDYEQVSKDSNWKLTGDIPRYATDKTEWTCEGCGTKKKMTLTYVKRGIKLGYKRCHICSNILNKRRCASRHTAKKYNSLAKSAGLKWEGKEVPRHVRVRTEWYCPKCKSTELRTYDSVRLAPRCLKCGRFVNGKRVSGVQIKLAEFLKAELNYRVGDRYIDCAFPDKKIAIEYDSYYYHGDRDDRPRNKEILDAGWKLWRIRSNWAIPKKHTAEYAIKQLTTTDRTHFVTTLKDWGRGPLWHQIKEKE